MRLTHGSLPMMDNHIITQINKKRTRPRRVTGTFLDILYQIKKAPANARASTTTAIVSLLQCEGR